MRPLVVIPAHNEAASLGAVVAEIRRHHPDLEILVVDDASDDGTADLLPQLGVRWLRLCLRLGVGGAVRAGIRYARARGHDVVVRLDADGQHQAADIADLLAPIQGDDADAASGSRYLEDGGIPTAGALRRAVHHALAAVLGAVLGEPATDPTSGFWAFGPRALELLAEHHPTGYPEPELLLLLRHNRLRRVEVAVGMRRRMAGRTSLTPPRAGIALARALLAMVVVPIRPCVDVRARGSTR